MRLISPRIGVVQHFAMAVWPSLGASVRCEIKCVPVSTTKKSNVFALPDFFSTVLFSSILCFGTLLRHAAAIPCYRILLLYAPTEFCSHITYYDMLLRYLLREAATER
eukprot:3489903-Rhodomonas_salina.1